MSQIAIEVRQGVRHGLDLEVVLTNIAGVVPAEADLEVVVVADERDDLAQELFALEIGNVVDAAAVKTACEEGLPACYGVGADHGL